MSVAVLALFGCNAGTDEFCATAVPGFEREIAEASARLPERKIVIRGKGNRAPASAEPVSGPGTARFTDEEKEDWLEWSEDRLKEIQRSLDLAAETPEMAPIRRQLSSAADHAVALHGFAASGNAEKMRESLGSIDTIVADVKQKVCPQPSR